MRSRWRQARCGGRWSEGGRRYFHYATDAPIGGEKPILSSAYAVHEEMWSPPQGAGQPVTIRIYYHPGHASIVDHVRRSVRATLEYGTKHFGPYPFGHVSVAERAAGGLGLSAESGNIDYSEQFALFNPETNPRGFDFPFAVVGHEMGHNFGVPYAVVEGVPVMSESLAWYTGMAVLEHEYGREHLDRLRAFMREPYPYPPIRQSAPLIRGLDPWAGYRRGPFALFALREYIGEEPRERRAPTPAREARFGKASARDDARSLSGARGRRRRTRSSTCCATSSSRTPSGSSASKARPSQLKERAGR